MADEQAAIQAHSPGSGAYGIPQALPASQADAEDPRDKAARLRREAAEIEATLPAPENTVRVKVEEPHTEFHFGAVSVGTEYTHVPASYLADFQNAAEAAGVTLTTEG